VSSLESELREKIAGGSRNPEDYLALAGILYSTTRLDESLGILREGSRLPFPNLPRAALLTSLGWNVIYVTNNWEESLSLGEQAVALTEGLETIESLIARAKAQNLIADCVSSTDSARATEVAMSALSLFGQVTNSCATLDNQTLYDVHFVAAHLNSLLGRTEEAVTQCAQAIQLAADDAEAHSCVVELGAIYRTAGRLAEARETFAKATKSAGVAPYSLVRPYWELGLTERALGKLPEARAKLQKAVELLQNDPAIPRVYLPELLGPIAEISYELGDFDGAAKANQALVDFCPSSDPLHWRSLLWLGQCQRDLGQLEMARINADRIAESSLAPEEDRECARVVSRDVKLNIAQSHYHAGDYASCITECEALIPQVPDADESYLALLLLLGHSYLGIRNNSSARKYYEAVLACPSASPTHRAIAERGRARLSARR
jgi:MalT-like TPR region